MRQIILDTETTGLSTKDGHRIIEIGCIEMVHRKVTGKTFHTYINPMREVDEGAMKVHGITNEFLADKPYFKDVAADFKQFILGAELIIHNAPFDIGFLDYELSLLNSAWQGVKASNKVVDTLVMARDKHPGQRNNLDALCKRYEINNQHRTFHGALLDASILAEVYLAMTGGQGTLFSLDSEKNNQSGIGEQRLKRNVKALRVVFATPEECEAHDSFMNS